MIGQFIIMYEYHLFSCIMHSLFIEVHLKLKKSHPFKYNISIVISTCIFNEWLFFSTRNLNFGSGVVIHLPKLFNYTVYNSLINLYYLKPISPWICLLLWGPFSIVFLFLTRVITGIQRYAWITYISTHKIYSNSSYGDYVNSNWSPFLICLF